MSRSTISGLFIILTMFVSLLAVSACRTEEKSPTEVSIHTSFSTPTKISTSTLPPVTPSPEPTRTLSLYRPDTVRETAWAKATQDALEPPTNTPKPSSTSTQQKVTEIPAIVPGSFEDFQSFARQIALAVQERDASFFVEVSKINIWYCIGDETMGFCKGKPANSQFEGIPVTEDWETYTLLSLQEYERRWQEMMHRGSTISLHATSFQYGDNPLMPLAAVSYQAILQVHNPSDAISTKAQVLFFEFVDGIWELHGELLAKEKAQPWLDGDCMRCYDAWEAWPN